MAWFTLSLVGQRALELYVSENLEKISPRQSRSNGKLNKKRWLKQVERESIRIYTMKFKDEWTGALDVKFYGRIL